MYIKDIPLIYPILGCFLRVQARWQLDPSRPRVSKNRVRWVTCRNIQLSEARCSWPGQQLGEVLWRHGSCLQSYGAGDKSDRRTLPDPPPRRGQKNQCSRTSTRKRLAGWTNKTTWMQTRAIAKQKCHTNILNYQHNQNYNKSQSKQNEHITMTTNNV